MHSSWWRFASLFWPARDPFDSFAGVVISQSARTRYVVGGDVEPEELSTRILVIVL